MRNLLVLALACASVPAAALSQVELAPLQVAAPQCSSDRLGAVIDAGQIGEPVSAVKLERFTWHEATERTPAMCVVEGQLLPVDRSDTARPIKFAVALPGSWNRRSIHQGGGGINGTVPQFAPAPPRGGGPPGGAAGVPGRLGGPGGPALAGPPGGRGGAPAGAPPGGGSDVSRGFAVYGSDSGHGATEQQWSLNDEAIRNFGYAQLKKTHDVAQILIQRMYGEAPRYRYFIGASQGGREGLTVAQRWPRDYHGVAANVPIVALSRLMQATVAIRQQEIPLAKHVPQAKGKAIAAEFMRQCDALDGLDDGLISHYMACREIFNIRDGKGTKAPWAAKRCPDGRDTAPADTSENACLTDGQIDTLQFIFSSQPYLSTMAHGTKSFGMWAPSTEVIVGGLPPASGNALLNDIRYAGQEGAAADARVFSALGSVGVNGFLLRDLSANPVTMVETRQHQKRQRELSEWLDSINPDLREFQRAGGKLIVAIGTNDTLASPGAQLDYYAALVKKMGQKQIDRFARLYVLPQRGHGLTGNRYALNGKGEAVEASALPSQFDRMTLLQKWVEQDAAPDRTQTVTGARSITGLMCSWPEYPHYIGGERDQAAAYRCRM